MSAIYKKELRSFYIGMLGYVFAAFMLLVIGVMTMYYCLGSTPSNTYEYVYGSLPIIYLIVIPILTMNSIAGERRNKTDQLLYTSPVSINKIVIGKYLAMCTVLLVPLAISGIYPFILKNYGNISIPTCLSSMMAYFLLGATLISVTMFVSSLTESQILSAAISFAVLFLLYSTSQLREYVSKTSYASLIFFTVLIAIFGYVINRVTKSLWTAIGCGVILEAGLVYMFFTNAKLLEGAASSFIGFFAVFTKIENFIYGIFDINIIIYYLSIIIFFCYLTIQSIDKRRWN